MNEQEKTIAIGSYVIGAFMGATFVAVLAGALVTDAHPGVITGIIVLGIVALAGFVLAV